MKTMKFLLVFFIAATAALSSFAQAPATTLKPPKYPMAYIQRKIRVHGGPFHIRTYVKLM